MFAELYAVLTPDEWLDIDTLCTVGSTIAQQRPELMCLAIRLNVQVNLFLRPLKTLSSDTGRFERLGSDTGCFALTERRAGVLSGHKVSTTFELIDGAFQLRTAQGDPKRWITHGDRADHCIVAAKNVHNDRDIRLFCIEQFRERAGVLSKAMHLPHMHLSSTLGLATISLDLIVPETALLDGTTERRRSALLNTLVYGRIMVAEGVVNAALGLIDHVLEAGCKTWFGEDGGALLRQRQSVRSMVELFKVRRTELVHSLDYVNALQIECVELATRVMVSVTTKYTTSAMSWPLRLQDLVLHKLAEGDTDVLRGALLASAVRGLTLRSVASGPFSMWQLARLAVQGESYVQQNCVALGNTVVRHTVTQLRQDCRIV